MWHGLLIDQKLEKADTSKFWQLLMNDCIDSCSSLSRLPLWVVGGTLRLPARLGAYFTVLGSMSCHMWHMFCTHNQYMFYTILTHFTLGIRISTQNLPSCNTWRAIKQSLYVVCYLYYDSWGTKKESFQYAPAHWYPRDSYAPVPLCPPRYFRRL